MIDKEIKRGDELEDLIMKDGWASAEYGKEYLFFLLYVGVHNPRDIVHGSAGIATQLYYSLKEYLNQNLKRSSGRFWILKKETLESIILFPFPLDPQKRVIPFRYSMKLVLNKLFFDMENSIIDDGIPLKICLHCGKIVYNRRIGNNAYVSEGTNFLFHLGATMKPSVIYLTEDIMQYIPDKIKEYVLPEDDFEGKKMYGIRLDCVE